jgi:carbon-monoxide dehydrogenase large subunit
MRDNSGGEDAETFPAMSYIGRSVQRLEDPPLLRGEGRFVADNNWPDQLHMRVVRSNIAFGKLLRIETAAALALDGVVAVWTAADISDIPQISFRLMNFGDLGPYRQWLLARDYVRYVGDPVAVVFATDPYVAEDAADLVRCEIDGLAAHLDATADLVEFMPGAHPGLLSEPAVVRRSYGDLAAAFSAAHRVVELEARIGRHSGIPMETRGALAAPDPGAGVLTMYGAAKVPHYNRNAISQMLGLGPGQLHLSEGHVGGGFGIRGELYPEDVLVCAAALRMGRPVKWIEDRREHFVAANHSREQIYRLKAAVDEKGFILGLDAQIFTDQGGYVRTHGVTVTDLACGLLPGPYVIPAYSVAGHVRLTNKTPAGTYRAPGRYESTFARERLIDKIATELRLSPIDVRRANLIPEAAMPFDRHVEALGTDVVYDTGKYHDLLERLLQHVDHDNLAKAVAARRAAGEAVGIGFAFFIEKSGLGPRDLVRMSVDANGLVEIVTGVASIGQGVETAMAQICAETLDVPLDRIQVIHGQTNRIEEGFGAFASRVTVMTGSAVKIAAEALRERAIDAAAIMLQCAPHMLRLAGGAVVSNDNGPAVTLAAVAEYLAPDAGLTGEGLFEADHMTYPYGVHFAQVQVDKSTCRVVVERYLVAYDIGRSINPMIVDGQIVGAAAQGIGGALFEEFTYDEQGQPLATTFADYLVPMCRDVPEIETLVREDAPTSLNPLGVKGAGEGGITAVGAAIASAIDDALQMPGAITRLPVTPSRLHAILMQ